jgi:hypothetical protein
MSEGRNAGVALHSDVVSVRGAACMLIMLAGLTLLICLT